MTADRNAKTPVCWVVTDGRAGIEAQALGLAEAIARKAPVSIVTKRVRLSAWWRHAPPGFVGDPFSHLDRTSDPLQPPFPDLWIGCGRAATLLTIAMKKRNRATFTIQLQDPRVPAVFFDLVIPPVHDGVAGGNVFPILGACNRVSASKPPLSAPTSGARRVAVLIGGPNRAFAFDAADAGRLAAQLASLAAGGAVLAITTSRRTPLASADILRTQLAGKVERFWQANTDAAADNPYPAMLSSADVVLVTEDSVNMAVEAASTGRPVYVLPLRRKAFASARKFDAFHESLRARGVSRIFDGRLEDWTYQPLDETARAADEAIRRWREFSRDRVR